MVEVKQGSSLCMDIESGSIQCVVTSPPYWGLRKYDGEQELVWGGDAECEHEWGNERRRSMSGGTAKSTLGELSGGHAISPEARVRSIETSKYEATQGTFCLKCGAWCGAYGLEPTPEMYVEHTVLFLREIRRVLKDDGVVFWNVGDSYAGGGRNSGNSLANTSAKQLTQIHSMACGKAPVPDGLKAKDLCMIPFRVALAAQADGWWVRSDIIWAKPNPMPESVRDRPTSSYEHIFMFTKAKDYYWDIDAVREPHSRDWAGENMGSLNPRADYTLDAVIPTAHVRQDKPAQMNPAGRNLRDVWTIATQPSGFKHYAAFPEEIPTRCIKAATSQAGECPKCGKPWVRVTQKPEMMQVAGSDLDRYANGQVGVHRKVGQKYQDWRDANPDVTIGWQPSCDCGLDPVSQTVLDPFCGTGRTLYAALKLGRNAVGYDLSEKYCDMARQRCGLIQEGI